MENLGLVELKHDELRKIDGGFWNYVAAAASTFLVDAIINYRESYNSIVEGYNAGAAAAKK